MVHEGVGAIQSTRALVHQLQYTGCGLESSQRREVVHETKELVTPQEWSYVTLPYREIRDKEGEKDRKPGRAPVTSNEQKPKYTS